MAEVEATLKRVNGHKGDMAEHCRGLIPELSSLARAMIRDLDPQNDLEFLRLRSDKYEILVAPRDDFVLIVVQDPDAKV